MPDARRLCIAVAVIAWSLVARDLPERFKRELFPSNMTPFREADADILGALRNFEETSGCGFQSVTRGSFSSAGSSEAVVSAGCAEAHADNYGSTVLLVFRSGTWEVAWREAGLITRHCMRVRFTDGRDGLLCKDFFSHMGSREQYLYTIDFSAPPKQRASFLVSTHDTMRTGWERCTEAEIERVEIRLPQLRVWVRHGSLSLSQEAREENLVGDAEPAPIPTRAYSLDYLLRGSRFQPTPATQQVLRIVSPGLSIASAPK